MKRRILGLFLVTFLILATFCNTTFAEKATVNAFPNIVHAVGQDDVKNADKPFSMVWFTDTQYYAESFPEIYDFLGDWFVHEYKKGGFGYVINTGDLVNIASNTNQWEVASRNFKKLDDANIPYGILAGNHDSIINGIDYSMFSKYFGASRYKGKPWYGGNMGNNRNHYDLISFGHYDFIILYLGYGTEATKETIKWSNQVLKKYSDRNAILAMHQYLEGNTTLSKRAQKVFDSIVVKNNNLMMVLCGHYYGTIRNVKTVTNSDGSNRKVLELLSDYQKGPNGGDGYLRYLHFNPAIGTLRVSTYSPYKNKFNFFKDTEDSFTQSIKLKYKSSKY